MISPVENSSPVLSAGSEPDVLYRLVAPSVAVVASAALGGKDWPDSKGLERGQPTGLGGKMDVNGDGTVIAGFGTIKAYARVSGEVLHTWDAPWRDPDRPSQLRHLDRAWAATIHSCQGRTVDQIIAAMPAGNRELVNQKSFYVAVSRARDHAELVTDDPKRLADQSVAGHGRADRGARRGCGTAGPRGREARRVGL